VQYEPATVVRNEEYGPGHWVIELKSSGALPEIRGGQFVSLRCDPHDKNSLLRPFSYLGINPVEQTFSIYYKHLGRMSSALSGFGPGTVLDALHPLGRPYPWQESWRRVALVGGGVGLAPLLLLAEQLAPYGDHMQVTAFFGGRGEPDLVPRLLAEYPELPLQLATDDGSQGFHGTVVELFRRRMDLHDSFDVVYICGPNPMMAAMQDAVPRGMPAFASLEEYMACGVGACLGCTAHIERDDQRYNLTTCKEGPVFPLHEVVFET
jgi:dihydroorotate dehydrogenase electron transfer subunit